MKQATTPGFPLVGLVKLLAQKSIVTAENQFELEVENMDEFRLQKVQHCEQGTDIYRFRADVWSRTTGTASSAFPENSWQDDHDAHALHWIISNHNDQIVASARLSLHNHISEVVEPIQFTRYGIEPQGLIASPDRVVVCPSAQRKGLAKRLLQAQDAASVEAGAVCALRQASPGMCRLIVRRGWQLIGPATQDARFPGVEFTVAVKEFQESAIRFTRTAA